MRGVAIRARYPMRGMGRRSPLGSRRTRVLFVTLETQLRPLGRLEFLETKYCAWLLAARGQMPTGWTVAFLARDFAVDVFMERLYIRFMTSHAETIVIDVFGVFDFGKRHVQRRIVCFLPRLIRVRTVRIGFGRGRRSYDLADLGCGARQEMAHSARTQTSAIANAQSFGDVANR